MLEINKNYVLGNNQKTIAVQIPIPEFGSPRFGG
jgi:hypothetical protein